ncbi:hypothetical protein MMC19_006857 [Ptychographa xylographoides]|nr:hypothetical protein [Ptychographa xylographoides]
MKYSGTYTAPSGGVTRAFDPRDMPCGPNDGSNGFLPVSVGVLSYEPIIAKPQKLLDHLPSSWATCYGNIFDGQDPPYALTPESGMGPVTGSMPTMTSADPIAETTAAAPGSISSMVPWNTGFGGSVPTTTPQSPQPSPDPKQNPDPSQNPDPPQNTDASQSSVPQQDPDPQQAGGSSLNPGSSPTSVPIGPPAIVIQSHTITENADPITINGGTVAYSSGTVYVGTSAQAVPTNPQIQPSSDPMVVAGLTVSLVPSSAQTPTPAVIVQGQTITENAPPITIDGTTVAYSAGSVYVGTSVQPVPTNQPPTQQAPPTPLVVAGLTLTPIPGTPSQSLTPTPVVIAGNTISVLNPSAIIIGTQTALLDHPAITVAGQIFSLAASGLVEGPASGPASGPGSGPASTLVLPAAQLSTTLAAQPTITPGPVSPPLSTTLVVGSHTIVLASDSLLLDGSTTLLPGAAGLTLGGTLVSLGSTALVIGTSTEVFAPASTGSETGTETGGGGGGLGGLILSGLGAGPVATPTASAAGTGLVFQGGAAALRMRVWHGGFWGMGWGLGVAWWAVVGWW